MLDELSDEKLVGEYLASRAGALEMLVGRYFKYVYNFLIKQVGDVREAQDLTQETFLRVWKNLKKFDQNRSFKVWLFRIARNAAIDYLRKKKILTVASLESEADDGSFLDNIPDPNGSIFTKIEQQEMEKETFEMLKAMPEIYRTVIVLYYNEGLNFREIGELLDEPLDTVKSRHRRALILLKKSLNSHKT